MSRLFLTIRLEPAVALRTSKSLPAGALQLAVEGMRAARLSGFLICACVRVYAETELSEIAEMIQFARSQDVDGIVVSSATAEWNSANPENVALVGKTAEARKLIENRWWESFSQLVEPVVGRERRGELSGKETGVRREQESHVKEEGVRVA